VLEESWLSEGNRKKEESKVPSSRVEEINPYCPTSTVKQEVSSTFHPPDS